MSRKKHNKTSVEKEDKILAFLPFCGSVSGKISHLLKRHKIESVVRPPAKIREILRPFKDAADLRTTGVYKIPCECGKSHIGQTV